MARVVASAPGSIMITGEHAVVYGHPAIVAAVDQRVTVEVTQTDDPVLTISSEIADDASYPMDALPTDGPYRFVCAAVNQSRASLDGGLAISIRSVIDPTLGLGSSAAVTVACLGALAQLTGTPTVRLHATALQIIRTIQGRGSGADLAASLHGGVVSYRFSPDDGVTAQIAALPTPPTFSLRYTGYKTPTSEVLARVAAARVGREAVVDGLYGRMGANAEVTIAAARDGDWPYAGTLMNDYQTLMVELGVSDATIDGIIAEVVGAPDLLGCKISGSGLGDCVLAMGAVPPGFVEAPLAAEGLVIHDQRS